MKISLTHSHSLSEQHLFPGADASSLSATTPPLKPVSYRIWLKRPGDPEYSRRGKTSTAPAQARCSTSLSKSTASTATSGRKEK